jgi:glycosyltransferase involved in cell wall biosynthesis
MSLENQNQDSEPKKKDFDGAILKRSRQVLDALQVEYSEKANWFTLINGIYASEKNGFFAWLAITGCYPTKIQVDQFELNSRSVGLSQACQSLIFERLKSLETAKLLYSTTLETTSSNNLVDITHTYSAPYLTGIQRVVRNILPQSSDVQTFVWVGDSGVIKLRQMSGNPVQVEKKQIEQKWRLKIVTKLHSFVPLLEKNPLGLALKSLLLPSARIFKRYLIVSEARSQLQLSKSGELTNLLIVGKRLTLPEIPSSILQISSYEAILEYSRTWMQVILFDFIPIFHAWTVHPGNRGHYNSYLRIVLMSDKVIAISSLVSEQAKLISKAFRLERNSWRIREQSFAFLALPSGLTSAAEDEFQKDSNLLLMVGSLEPRKNHLLFLSALEILAIKGIDFKARILGTAGWENEVILDKISSVKAKGIDLELLSRLNDNELRDYIGKAQVVLQLSEAEGFGLPIVEALALGTKVIVTDISPLKEWENERVSVVSLGDPNGLASILEDNLANSESLTGAIIGGVSWQNWIDLLY